jgi:hypothetical protein
MIRAPPAYRSRIVGLAGDSLNRTSPSIYGATTPWKLQVAEPVPCSHLL